VGVNGVKKRLGCLGFLLFLLAGYAVWALYPPSRYAAQLQEVYQGAQARHEASQLNAKNAATNGYLDPTFLPYWGRKNIEGKPNSELAAQLKKLDNYSDLHAGKEQGLEQKVGDPQTGQLFSEFGAIYDKLHQALALPKFVPPDDQPVNAGTLVPNFLAFRSLEQYLSAYAEYLSLSGQSDRALAVCQDMLRFSKVVNSDGSTLIQLMISVATRAISQSTLAMVLQTGSAGRPAVLQELSKTLTETQFSEEDFLNAFYGEYYMVTNSVLQLGQKPLVEGQDTNAIVYRLPGLVSREFRLYQNDYFPILEKARQGDYRVPDWLMNFGWFDWFTGQHAYLSGIVIPNSTRAHLVLELSRKRQAFLQLYIELLLARQKSGKWPATLKDLQAGGFKPLPPLDLTKVAYQVEGDKMELKLSLSEQEQPNPARASVNTNQEWEILDRADWVLHQPPKQPTPFR
jgi:hypothetical protein